MSTQECTFSKLQQTQHEIVTCPREKSEYSMLVFGRTTYSLLEGRGTRARITKPLSPGRRALKIKDNLS